MMKVTIKNHLTGEKMMMSYDTWQTIREALLNVYNDDSEYLSESVRKKLLENLRRMG